MPFVETLIGAVRQLQLPGKGRVFDPITPRSGTRTARVWGDYVMSLDLANAIHRQIYMGCFGRDMTVWTRSLLPPGGVFLDIGAHIGYFSLLAAHTVGPRGKVHALEPNPSAFAALQRHLQENGVTNVAASQIALAEEQGVLPLYTPPAAEARDYNVTFLPRDGWNRVEIPAERLDTYLARERVERIDVAKMDVEGAEPRVVAGGAESLRAGIVRHLVTEVNGPRLVEAGSSPQDLVARLRDLGFLPARLAGSRAEPVAEESWDLAPDHEYDRLFVHRLAL